jgi:hypothetical protein
VGNRTGPCLWFNEPELQHAPLLPEQIAQRTPPELVWIVRSDKAARIVQPWCRGNLGSVLEGSPLKFRLRGRSIVAEHVRTALAGLASGPIRLCSGNRNGNPLSRNANEPINFLEYQLDRAGPVPLGRIARRWQALPSTARDRRQSPGRAQSRAIPSQECQHCGKQCLPTIPDAFL